jgi:hypothetical protein
MFTNRNNVLVTKQNLPLVAAGTKLFAANGTLNILPGQLGIFDAFSHIALGAATVVNSKDIYFAVGIDTNGDGAADEIRKTAGEHWNKCSTDVAQAEPPRQECVEIMDFKFKCIECNTDYAIKIQLEGVEWMPYFESQHLPTYPFNIHTTCCTECEDDTPTYSCATFVEELVEMVRQTKNQAANLIDQKYPFDIVPLSINSTEYTLPCIDNKPAAIRSLVVDGVAVTGICAESGLTPVNGAWNPNQLDIFKAWFDANELFKGATVDFYKACSDGCWKMVINNFVDDAVYGNLTVLAAGQNCDTGNVTVTPKDISVGGDYSCGFRVIPHMFPAECGCFPPKEYRYPRSAQLRVFPLSGFDCAWETELVQTLQIQEGHGTELRWEEYKQQTGGQGRTYDSYHTHYGKLGVYSDRVRESITAECVNYCQYKFIYHAKSTPLAPMGWTNNTHLMTTVAIPSEDATTLGAFETVVNAWITQGTCALSSITCAEEYDIINSNVGTSGTPNPAVPRD